MHAYQYLEPENPRNQTIAIMWLFLQFILEHVRNCWQVLDNVDGCCKMLRRVKHMSTPDSETHVSSTSVHPSPQIEIIWENLPPKYTKMVPPIQLPRGGALSGTRKAPENSGGELDLSPLAPQTKDLDSRSPWVRGSHHADKCGWQNTWE